MNLEHNSKAFKWSGASIAQMMLFLCDWFLVKKTWSWISFNHMESYYICLRLSSDRVPMTSLLSNANVSVWWIRVESTVSHMPYLSGTHSIVSKFKHWLRDCIISFALSWRPKTTLSWNSSLCFCVTIIWMKKRIGLFYSGLTIFFFGLTYY